jgi:hypothetical protein
LIFLFEPVRFGLFGFSLLKPKPNRTEPACFLIFLIGFFFRFGFFNYFFSSFLGLIGFSVFLLTPKLRAHISLCTQKFKAFGVCECVIFTAEVRRLSEVTCRSIAFKIARPWLKAWIDKFQLLQYNISIANLHKVIKFRQFMICYWSHDSREFDRLILINLK